MPGFNQQSPVGITILGDGFAVQDLKNSPHSFAAYASVGLMCHTADMGRGNNPWLLPEGVICSRRFCGEGVQTSARQMPRLDRRQKRIFVNQAASGGVDDIASLWHQADAVFIDHFACLIVQRTVQAENVGPRKQGLKAVDAFNAPDHQNRTDWQKDRSPPV